MAMPAPSMASALCVTTLLLLSASSAAAVVDADADVLAAPLASHHPPSALAPAPTRRARAETLNTKDNIAGLAPPAPPSQDPGNTTVTATATATTATVTMATQTPAPSLLDETLAPETGVPATLVPPTLAPATDVPLSFAPTDVPTTRRPQTRAPPTVEIIFRMYTHDIYGFSSDDTFLLKAYGRTGSHIGTTMIVAPKGGVYTYVRLKVSADYSSRSLFSITIEHPQGYLDGWRISFIDIQTMFGWARWWVEDTKSYSTWIDAYNPVYPSKVTYVPQPPETGVPPTEIPATPAPPTPVPVTPAPPTPLPTTLVPPTRLPPTPEPTPVPDANATETTEQPVTPEPSDTFLPVTSAPPKLTRSPWSISGTYRPVSSAPPTPPPLVAVVTSAPDAGSDSTLISQFIAIAILVGLMCMVCSIAVTLWCVRNGYCTRVTQTSHAHFITAARDLPEAEAEDDVVTKLIAKYSANAREMDAVHGSPGSDGKMVSLVEDDGLLSDGRKTPMKAVPLSTPQIPMIPGLSDEVHSSDTSSLAEADDTVPAVSPVTCPSVLKSPRSGELQSRIPVHDVLSPLNLDMVTPVSGPHSGRAPTSVSPQRLQARRFSDNAPNTARSTYGEHGGVGGELGQGLPAVPLAKQLSSSFHAGMGQNLYIQARSGSRRSPVVSPPSAASSPPGAPDARRNVVPVVNGAASADAGSTVARQTSGSSYTALSPARRSSALTLVRRPYNQRPRRSSLTIPRQVSEGGNADVWV